MAIEPRATAAGDKATMSTEPAAVLLIAQPQSPSSLVETFQVYLAPHARLDATDLFEVGLQRLGRENYQAVLFDVTSGDDATLDALVKVQAAAPAIPVIAVSAQDDPNIATRALRLGAQDYLWPGRITGTQIKTALDFAMERHRIARERQAGLERLRELERTKTQFINTAAHELNSPLTPIRLQLHLLGGKHSEGLSEQQQRALDIVERNVERLIQLIADILEAARLQANRLVVKKEPVDLERIVKEVVETYREPARAQGVTLGLTTQGGLRVDADADRMSQVLFNLVGNALKFTARGGTVEVRARLEKEYAIVSVRDDGIGLRPEDFPRLFQPFSQTHEWIPEKKSGTGLGLYISHGIVEQHGGRMWVDSAGPGQGATFSFALPILRREGPTEQAPPVPVEPARLTRKTGVWPILYFRCPTCGSWDIQMRILKNKYECRACADDWQ